MTATAAASTQKQNVQFTVGGAQIHLQQVQLREDLLIDEVHLDGTEIAFEAHKVVGEEEPLTKISVAETKFTAMMTEPNLNRLLTANMPSDVPVRGMKLALLSGKARITGSFVKSVLSLPFTLEGVPVLDNGMRVLLDFQAGRLGLPVPGPILEVVEQLLNRVLALDLAKLPIPVRLDEIKCEPGRLTIKGKARIVWPPVVAAPTPPPFSALSMPLPQEIPTEPSVITGAPAEQR